MDQPKETQAFPAPREGGETIDHVSTTSATLRVVGTAGPSRLLGKFELLKKVGAGGFGEVWKAKDTELGRIVAIKFLHAGRVTDSSDRERFFREARAAAQLRHPGIAAVYEVTEIEGAPAIVSAFIDGMTLRDLRKARALTFRESAALTAQVAEALDYAHAMKLVHRDVKPANIMIELGPEQDPSKPIDLSGAAQSGGGSISQSARPTASGSTTQTGPRALLLDFGLALRDEIESTLTLDGQILGTPAYMSPEQAAGEGHHVDRRTDVYSLGVVLYELLAGELPFTGSRVALVSQVLSDEPRAPRTVNPKVPRDLETICLKAMAKSRHHRYATARELGEDLQRWLAGIPILARHVGPLERAWRWCRRNPLVAVSMAATALALMAGIIASTTMAIIANNRADKIADINRDLDKATQEAKDQARTADEQSQLAYKTLESVIFDIQTKLAAVPNAQRVRGDLLRTAIQGLEKLSANLQADKRVDRTTAVATLNLAEVFRQISNDTGGQARTSANQLYDRAVAMFEDLHKASPDDPVLQSDLAEASLLFAINLSRTDDLGANTTHDMVKEQKGRTLLVRCGVLGKRAIELRRRLLAADPDDRTAKYELARALAEWAYQETRSGDPPAAQAALLEAYGLLKSLLAADPRDVRYRFLFGRTASRLGDYYYDMVKGAHEQAAPYYTESLDILKHLAAERPTDHDAQTEYANAWSRMADLYATRGEVRRMIWDTEGWRRLHEDALKAFRKELEITQALEKLAPNNMQTLADSSISYDHVSRELKTLKRFDEAVPVLVRVLEIRKELVAVDPDNRRHHAQIFRPVSRLGEAYQELKQPDKALETYDLGLTILTAFRTRTGDHSLDGHMTQIREFKKKLANPPDSKQTPAAKEIKK